MHFTRFPSLRNIPHLQHAITQRADGVSPAPFASLNLGLHVGDDENAVRQNREIVARELNYVADDCVFAQQTHGTNAHIVMPADHGRGAQNFADALPDCDALIVAHSNTPAMILVADCAPLLFVDARLQVLAVVHAGWRGASAGIARKTIAKMRAEFGCDAADIRVGIGPCLCVDCLEIGEEAAAQILAEGAASTCIVRAGFEKPHLDLRRLLIDDLARVQVLAGQVEALEICPRCANEDYFSYRGDGGITGRFGLVAWWS